MSIISDVIEETTKITIIKNATSTNSLKISASELVFNEIVNSSTINEKLKLSQTQISINGNAGADGQVLMSNGSTLNWQTIPSQTLQTVCDASNVLINTNINLYKENASTHEFLGGNYITNEDIILTDNSMNIHIKPHELSINNGSSLYTKLNSDSIIFCDKTTYNETILTILSDEKLQIKNNTTLTNNVEINSSRIIINNDNASVSISKEGITTTAPFDLNIQSLKVNGENHNASINQVLGVNSSGTLIFKEMTIGNTTEPIGTELISENIVLPIVINGNTYYIQLFTKPP
jgi:hypothetical protein